MEVVGYSDRLSVRPGDPIQFMVSCAGERFEAEVVRLGGGERVVPSEIDGSYPARRQHLRPGSYVRVEHAPPLALADALTARMWVWPTLLAAGTQTLLAKCDSDYGAGLALQLDSAGRLVARIGHATLRSSGRLVERRWQRVGLDVDLRSGVVRTDVDGTVTAARAELAQADAASNAPLTIGALLARMPEGDVAPTACFNGKLEEVELERDGALVARWDFSREQSSRRVVDVGPSGLHGTTVNRPTRAVTGRRWRRAEIDPRTAPEQWAAIHFHDDDLDDAGWEADVRWRVPADLPSGVYALRVRAVEGSDEIPFFVCPPLGAAGGRVAVVLPTFTYLAYGNEHMLSDPEKLALQASRGVRVRYPARPAERYVVDNDLHSLYDTHRDGSGVSLASRLRPITTMRPRAVQPHLSGGDGAPHGLSADLHLIDWLEHEGIGYDVLTDEELHHEGAAVLSPYDVVLTGTHPEYVSGAIVDAFDGYASSGGRLMYLGGNGFYWVAALDPHEGHTIEVRRWGPATRTWEAQPGEWFLSFTGEPGGLWRFRDRAPQRLCGVGITAEGNGPGRPYERSEASRAPEVAFAFAGLDPDAAIGAEPALVNGWGAAGFEVDRLDEALGTPEGTVLLASARGFSDRYQAIVDDVLVTDSRQGGDVNPLVRADMTLLERPGGGAVFAVGSIQWCSCLPANDHGGTVAVVTGNVLRRFLDPTPLGLAVSRASADAAVREGAAPA